MRIVTLLISAVFFSGCKLIINATVYTSDIVSVFETHEPKLTPIEIQFEQSSTNNCNENSGQLLAALAKHYETVEFLGCYDADFDTFARFRIVAEIVYEAVNKLSDSTDPIYIGVFEDGEQADTDITVAIFKNGETLKTLWDNVSGTFPIASSRTPEITITATIANDSGHIESLHVADVFANGVPVVEETNLDVAHRNQIDILLSNVTNSAFATKSFFAVLAKLVHSS